MINKSANGQPVQVTPSDLDAGQVRRLRRAVRTRHRTIPASEVDRRADIADRTGLPSSTVDRARDRAGAAATYRHPDDYLADRLIVFERGDREGC